MTEEPDVRDAGIILEAIKIGIAQSSRDGYVLRLGLEPTSVPPEIMTSQIGTRYKVVLVEMDGDGNPVISQEQQDGAKALKQVGMLCREQVFWNFLTTHTGKPVLSEDDAAISLCQLLGIPSRKVLKTNSIARAAWHDLFERFLEDRNNGKLR